MQDRPLHTGMMPPSAFSGGSFTGLVAEDPGVMEAHQG